MSELLRQRRSEQLNLILDHLELRARLELRVLDRGRVGVRLLEHAPVELLDSGEEDGRLDGEHVGAGT